jgi:hypothetical protein
MEARCQTVRWWVEHCLMVLVQVHGAGAGGMVEVEEQAPDGVRGRVWSQGMPPPPPPLPSSLEPTSAGRAVGLHAVAAQGLQQRRQGLQQLLQTAQQALERIAAAHCR